MSVNSGMYLSGSEADWGEELRTSVISSTAALANQFSSSAALGRSADSPGDSDSDAAKKVSALTKSRCSSTAEMGKTQFGSRLNTVQ